VRLGDVLKAEQVVVPLAAATVKDATERLAERLIAAGAVAEPQRLTAVIRHAWPEDMVSVGEHAFLPHFRTEAVRGLVAALGVAAAPIRWERDPHRTARIVILIVAPPRDTPRYLQVVGGFARALSDEATVAALLAARDPEAVARLASLADIELPSHLVVRDVMTPHVYTTSPEKTLGEVAQFMVEHDVRALPVVDEAGAGALVGIITHREILRFLIPGYVQRSKSGEYRAPTAAQLQRGGDPRRIPVKEVMSRSVLCLSEEQTLSEVATLMNNKDVERFPVVREGVVVGFLTRADLVRRLLSVT
jgi:CBS domain-containing protein